MRANMGLIPHKGWQTLLSEVMESATLDESISPVRTLYGDSTCATGVTVARPKT